MGGVEGRDSVGGWRRVMGQLRLRFRRAVVEMRCVQSHLEVSSISLDRSCALTGMHPSCCSRVAFQNLFRDEGEEEQAEEACTRGVAVSSGRMQTFAMPRR